MSWLIIEIWRAVRDTRAAKQEENWRNKLIDLGVEKEISRIQSDLDDTKIKLLETETDLLKVKASYHRARASLKEDESKWA